MNMIVNRPQFDLDLLIEGKAYLLRHKDYNYLLCNQHCILKYRDRFKLVFAYAKCDSRKCSSLKEVTVSIDDVVKGISKIIELVEE